MDEDVELVEAVARDFVRWRGAAPAVVELKERAEIAAAQGDDLSAEAWQDIARAAKRHV